MYQHILVPFDGSPTSTRGLDEAIKLASLTGAALRLVHMVDDLRYATGFETYAAYANDVIPYMRQAGERNGRVLLGSDAEQIVRTAPVPVLLVRGAS